MVRNIRNDYGVWCTVEVSKHIVTEGGHRIKVQILINQQNSSVAQLVRAPDC